jgi:DNA-binding transcriptional LysR family regulator
MVDLVLLRSLIAVADVGTISGAADRVGVSQSALSRRLQQIERDMGTELLVRGRNGVELTELGRQVVDEGRALVSRYDRLRSDIGDHLGLDRGSVRVGAGATVTSYLLPAWIAEFRASHPGIRFQVKEAGSREVAADVSAGDLELGVVTLPVTSRELDSAVLTTDEVVLAIPSGHPFASRRVVAADLEGLSFVAFEPGSAIRQIVDGALRAAGIEVDIVMELRSIPSILKMVATTGHLAFVSQLSMPAEGVSTVKVRGLAISRALGVVTRRGMPLSPASRAFADLIGAPNRTRTFA